jgi:thioredoxin 1
MAGPFSVSDSDFNEKVLQSELPILVDFWADWCMPCKMIAPIVEELSQEYDGKLDFAKLDVDSNPSTAMTYGVRSIPTLLIFKDGRPIDQIVGAAPKGALKKKIDSALE